MTTTKPSKKQIREMLVAHGMLPADTKPLWPTPYDKLNAESAYRFIIDCVETEEESTGQPMRIPDKNYLRRTCEEWHWCLANGKPMAFIKSRRLIVSWLCTALEVHVAGIKPGNILVSGATYEGNNGAKSFVRRHAFIYRRLRATFPEWKLPAATESGGNYMAGELSKVVLATGATIQAINSDGESFRGGGTSIVRMEELSQWPDAAIAWTQAQVAVQGPPGKVGGFAYAVNNASPNPQFLELIQR